MNRYIPWSIEFLERPELFEMFLKAMVWIISQMDFLAPHEKVGMIDELWKTTEQMVVAYIENRITAFSRPTGRKWFALTIAGFRAEIRIRDIPNTKVRVLENYRVCRILPPCFLRFLFN
jgi:hypothetical protein